MHLYTNDVPLRAGRRYALKTLALLPLIASANAAEPAWPNKPIRLIVPFAAGGGNDTLARLIGENLSQTLGQRVIVDNRGGAGGVVGAELAARAEPDGYTLFLGGVGSHAINPVIRAKLSYDPIRDFAPISLVASAPLVVVTHPSLGVHNVAELLTWSRSHPGQLEYASNGVGSSSHLAAELFATAANIRMTHIPYKGLAPAMADLLSGQVKIMFSSLVAIVPFVQAGRLTALATTGAARSPLLPNTPTVSEGGVRDYRAGSWYGVLAPAGTPAAIISKVDAAIQTALARSEVRAQLSADGAEPIGGGPQAFATHIRTELGRVRELAQRIGLKPE